MSNKYDLLIVGNGFDRHLNYETEYTHFCKYLYENRPIKNGLLYFFWRANKYGYMLNDEWTSFEQLLCRYLEFLNYLFTDVNVSLSFKEDEEGLYVAELTIRDVSNMPTSCKKILDIGNPLRGFVDVLWCDNEGKRHCISDGLCELTLPYEELVLSCGEKFSSIPSLDDYKRCVLKKFNELLNGAEKELSDYIRKVTSKQKPKTSFLKKRVTEAARIVSFNYSHTAAVQYGLPKEMIAYVHGQVDNQIVLGIEEGMVEDQTIDEKAPLFNPFFKRSRRFIKKCNENFKTKILDKIYKTSKIAVFGHSLDRSDRSIFRKIFNCEFKHCDIYYYGEEKDYRAKLIELVGIDKVEELSDSGKISFIKIPKASEQS